MRRRRPVTPAQTLLGLLGVVAVVVAIAGLSGLLRLPAEQVAELPPPELGDTGRQPGQVVCPTRADLRRRPEPIPVASTELIECPDLFDGREVTYTGEAVGAVLLRTRRAWVHLNDDPYGLELGPTARHRTTLGGNSGMAVSVPRGDGVGVTIGSHRTHGTALRVMGVYHKSYAEEGGAPAIRADEVTVIRPAQSYDHPVSLRRVAVAPPLAAIALLLLAVALRRRRLLE